MPRPSVSQRFVAAVRASLAEAGLTRLVVGCSGGPDSTALLLALAALQGELGLELLTVYVDHGLRPEAAAEGQRVLALAAGLDLPGEVARISVPAGPSLMAAARGARYQALAEAAGRVGAQAVAVGHTLSDQGETLLMRLLGGAGLRGLGGMAARRPLAAPGFCGLLYRPLLGLTREEVLAFLDESGVVPLQDPTNTQLHYQRNRLRHEVLPLLRRERPDLDAHLGELAAQLRADAEYLDRMAEEALGRLRAEADPLPFPGPAMVLLPAGQLAALPRALAARVIAAAAGGGLSRRHVEDVLALCRSLEGSSAIDLPRGRRAERRYGTLALGGINLFRDD